jgi:hypothetical protein
MNVNDFFECKICGVYEQFSVKRIIKLERKEKLKNINNI